MANVADLDKELNHMILQGKALDAFEKFYADDCIMQEPHGEPFCGKDVNRKREQEFFSNVEQFFGAELLSSAVTGDSSFSEWVWDVKMKGQPRTKMEQVSRRTWKNGKVAHERFYYNAPH
jgi:ketosteroid isomerase-like protein